ncbi:unnamed protein product (macronuclear) [Paramecium tetraurelia]|uniref:Uncharacterized protein n=1 Tax=Paramecium tetraurelia TaxID=5888 RepID=A0BQS0_PARTE|nr:uncharacterized protein GSPATT00031116001 [Paramecium tetraurelia]CAK60887.1 unnamed protein product [Paramecium tetraurelia]|eukprot:XP_001428285.1 hypothetical protein (macronuclear) [Paramecium tetraurelia strain d4-2]
MQLEQRVSKIEKLTEQLLGRICELEDQQGDLQDQIKKLKTKNQQLEQEIAGLKNKTEEIQESWLFYCDKKRPLHTIKSTLQIESDIVREFDYQSWVTEDIMWRQIIKNISKEQPKDLEKLNGAQLKQLGVQKLKENIDNEVLFVLRNVNKENEKMNELIELCAIFTQLWYEIELGGEQCQGRLILVIESDVNLDKLELTRQDNSKVILQIEKLQN